ncbi:MAG: DUF5719 family protein [Intrasporangium sp.]|uniref:DUF5719 family protein n=1 Tax=Intrasporangium sp. TaxID=1925024 RepID=UPI003F810103
MTPVGSILRATVLAVCAGALVGIATTTTGSVELGGARTSAGLPAVSDAALTDASLVCPGPERVGAKGLRDVAGDTRVTAASAPASVLGDLAAKGAGSIEIGPVRGGKPLQATSDPAAVPSATIPGPAGVVVRAKGALAPGVVAAQTWLHRGDDDRGLAAAACALPASDLWLIGGGDGPSRTERLVLTNPGANTISVDFTVLGTKGTIEGTGRGISIPPRSRSVISLDTLAPDVASPVVHVVASGGQVSGVLSDAWIDGATGRGIDDAAPAAQPAKDLVVAGIDKAGAASVRIGNPGEEEALVQVRVLTEKGPVQPDALRAVRVPAGSSLDVPLDVPDGATGAHLIADQPVVAGAWVERRVASGADRMGDFGWAPATPSVKRLAGLALPGSVVAGSTTRLLLAAGAKEAAVTVTTTGPGAQARQVTVPADHSVVVDLGAAQAVWVQPRSGAVHAAVSVSGVVDDVPVLSIVPLPEAPVTAATVPVRQVGN